MNCAICGRALRAPAYCVAAGPVGPVCAQRVGMAVRKRIGRHGFAASQVRLPRDAGSDARQVDWVAEAAA